MIHIRPVVKLNPLFFAFLLPAVVDGVVTLLGQGVEYWENARVVNEASPAFYFLLASPWLFVLGGCVWFLVWYRVFLKLREPINLFLMFLFVAGHSWGSSSWIMKMFKQAGVYTLGNQPSIVLAWGLLVVYFGVVALAATYCLRVYITRTKLVSVN